MDCSETDVDHQLHDHETCGLWFWMEGQRCASREIEAPPFILTIEERLCRRVIDPSDDLPAEGPEPSEPGGSPPVPALSRPPHSLAALRPASRALRR